MPNTSKKPIITFAISCYNVANTLDKMLDSIISQTYTDKNGIEKKVANSNDIEIVLVEDCSNDNGKTLKVCKDYSEKFKNIKLIVHKENKGLSVARNTGISNANGKYISFPDGDDIMCDGIISKYINCCNEDDFDIVCASLIENQLDKNNKVILTNKIEILPGEYKNSKKISKKSIELEKNITFGYAWNKIYKLDLIKQNQIMFVDGLLYIEDLLFNIETFKYAKKLKVINFPAIVYNRRLNQGKSITASYIQDYFDLHYKRIEALYKYWNETNVLDDNAKSVLANLYFRYLLSAIWRNKSPESSMSKKQQKEWLINALNLDLSKSLIKHYNSNSIIIKVNKVLFKKKLATMLLMEAGLINFTNNKMYKVLTKIKTKR